jgi:hypothetical protein
VNKFIPSLLRVALWSLHVTVGYAADAHGVTKEIAGVTASDPVAVPNTPVRAVASVSPRRTLDLRPPDLASLHVQSLPQVVTFADSDETEAVTIAGAPLLPEQKADTHPSLAGVASLYWAARHPTEAWRVFLPIQLDGYDTAADIKAGCAVIATVPSGRLACS